jgi:hypothetical protein
MGISQLVYAVGRVSHPVLERFGHAFNKQYQYNLDMAPSRTQHQKMTQKEGESFKVYAEIWRELAAQVRLRSGVNLRKN